MKNEIYKITNKINSKIYIGLTIQGTRTRYLHHLYEARSGSNFPIHRAIRKYGQNNFEVETIRVTELQDELKDLECKYIKEYKSNIREFGYNMTDGGDGTFGRKHSDTTKEKIRQKAIGRKSSEETKSRLKEAIARNKEEDWYKESRKLVGFKSNLSRSKRIAVYDLNNNYIETFNSIAETAIKLNINKSTIFRKLNNKERKSRTVKYRFEYTT